MSANPQSPSILQEFTTTPGPLFIGGVPRSGTSALASLIARHSRYTMIPREVRFHTAVGEASLPDLLEGHISLSEFVDRMANHWWKRTASWDSNVMRGLYKTIPEDRFRLCLEHFEKAYPTDAFGAARDLMNGLFDPIADEAGKSAWIEMTPTNFLVAPLLYRIYPNMKLIHTMRDGRDVALSVRDLPWGRDGTVIGGLRMWQRMLREAHAAFKEVPRDRILTIQLEDLVANHRDQTYAHILEFLELEDEPSMHQFFDKKISAENAHAGRWRVSYPPMRRMAFTGIYGCALARLAIAGVSPRPSLHTLERSPDQIDLARRPQRETIDPWADGQAKDA
jgi:hypothetical protein